ncbi:MAG TPA: potassium transporter TrkG [Afifellaceae bacterium]|nr:potassium transporter TrkG [Afifellaceae bacterium]
MPTIVLHLAFLTAGLAGLMVFPALIALARGEAGSATGYITTALLTVGSSITLIVALRGITVPARRVHALTLVSITWPILAAIAAIPMWFVSDMSYWRAVFESLSAVTTTGFTLITNIDAAPASMLAWRSALQWYGGFLTLLAVTLVLAPLGVGGLPTRRLSFMDESARTRQLRLTSQIRIIAFGYAATTLICTFWLLASGVQVFDAFCLAMSTVSTGGMTTHDGPIDTFVPPFGQVGLILFMIIGGTSIIWHGMILRLDGHQLKRHREAYVQIAMILILGLTIAEIYHISSGRSLATVLTAAREGLFAAASLISTTGFQVREESFSVLPVGVLFALLLIGGGALSTAGGLKFFRVGILLLQSGRELSRSLFPHGVDVISVGGRRWNRPAVDSLYTMVLAFVLVLASTVCALSLQDIGFEPAVIASLAALSNAGPVYGAGPDAGQPWLALSSFPAISLSALSVAMILGRIELLALFSLLNIAYWRSR